MKQTDSPLIALIGCGDWGKNIANTLNGLNSLGAIVDQSNAFKVMDLAKRLNVPYLELNECLNNKEIQGVVIATPSQYHFDLAEKALSHGKHVLLEKPMTLSSNHCQILIDLAKSKGLILMVGHLLRYHSAFKQLVDWGNQEKLGQILNIQTYRKNLGKINPVESVSWDLGPHDLSLVLALKKGRMPFRLLAQRQCYFYQPYGDIETILMDYQDGTQVQINLSRMHPFKEQKVIMIGTEGAAVFDDVKPWESKAVLYENFGKKSKDNLVTLHPDTIGKVAVLAENMPLKEEISHFMDCIQNNKIPLTPGEEGKHVCILLEAVEKSIETSAWVDF